jgi:hypothetical protein
MSKDDSIYIFISPKGEVTMWVKRYIWHKWMPKTPKLYADSMSKFTGKREDGPTWWGMHDESPETKGYKFIGVIK